MQTANVAWKTARFASMERGSWPPSPCAASRPSRSSAEWLVPTAALNVGRRGACHGDVRQFPDRPPVLAALATGCLSAPAD